MSINLSINATPQDFELIVGGTPIQTIETLGVYEAFVTMFAFFLVVIIVHELGHFLLLSYYNKDAKIYVERKGWFIEIYTGQNEDYWVLTPEKRYYVYFAGIIAGFIPIAIFSSLHQFYLLLLAPYVVGLTSDVENILRSIKQMHALNKKQTLQTVKKE